MSKKASAKVKRPAGKRKKTKTLQKNKAPKPQTPSSAQSSFTLTQDPRFTQAVQNYEAGVKAMQERKFERAKALLEKVMTSGSRELADRAAMHLNSCQQQLARASNSGFKSAEEHYDYAISLMNASDYESARAHLEKLQKQVPKADYVWFGLAILDCLTHHYEAALKNLEQAIKLNASNRYHARNESDFQNMADDPRFTELLYPEELAASAAPATPGGPAKKRR
jgi:tetratricopeptide (TPR) repeat protein